MFQSRKFRVLVIDTIFSVLFLMATWYLVPDQADRVIEILGLLQVPVVMYIGGTALEDYGAKRAGKHITQTDL